MRESALEQFFAKRVRLAGGISFKIAPTTAGLPDRLVLWPGGVIQVVELKTDTGRLSEAQKHLHAKIEALGTTVHVVRGRLEAIAWIRRQVDNRSPFPEDVTR